MSIVNRLLSGPSNVDCLAAADLLKQQAERIKELEAENANFKADQESYIRNINASEKQLAAMTEKHSALEVESERQRTAYGQQVSGLMNELAALRQRIADAPVVAWQHGDYLVNSKCHDENFLKQEGRPLISKEDLQK